MSYRMSLTLIFKHFKVLLKGEVVDIDHQIFFKRNEKKKKENKKIINLEFKSL